MEANSKNILDIDKFFWKISQVCEQLPAYPRTYTIEHVNSTKAGIIILSLLPNPTLLISHAKDTGYVTLK
jgi:hypothetical protein